jgi:hypothetical protein
MIVVAYSGATGLKVFEAESFEAADRILKYANHYVPADWVERIPERAYGKAWMLQRLGWRGSRDAFIREMRQA